MSSKLTQNLTELVTVDTANDKIPIVDSSDPSELKYTVPDNIAPSATATVAGKVELATTAETETGTDATRAVTPDGLHDMTSLAGAAWFLDEDTMVSDSAVKVPSQQSVKAYVDRPVFTTLNVLQLFAPRGFMINGKFTVTDTGSGITIALKTLAGADPSEADPVYIRIGDTVRSVTAALSRAISDGTNHCNAGSSELATKEIDWALYAVWDSNSSAVALSPSRIFHGNLVSDFSATTTNEKHLIGYSDYTTTDEVEIIGRFAATLSAGAGYTWSVPTYDANNLIQRPIYETRNLTFSPVRSVSGGTVPTYTSSDFNQYKIVGDRCIFRAVWDNASGGTAGAGANNLTSTLPFGVLSSYFVGGGDRNVLGYGQSYESAGTLVAVLIKNDSSSSSIRFMNGTGSVSVSGNDQSSTVRYMNFQGEYPI